MPCWEFFIISCDSNDIDGGVVHVKLHGGSMVVDVAIRPDPQLLHHRRDHHPGEGDQLAEDEPDVDHLDVCRRWQLVHHRYEDGRHHQHRRQVHRHRSLLHVISSLQLKLNFSMLHLKVEGSEEGGGI